MIDCLLGNLPVILHMPAPVPDWISVAAIIGTIVFILTLDIFGGGRE